MSKEKRCPSCDTELNHYTFNTDHYKCGTCEFRCASDIFERMAFLTDSQRKWLKHAPDFDDDGQTEILFNEVLKVGDYFWDINTKTWQNKPVPIGKRMAIVCRQKAPEWKIEELPGDLVIISDGESEYSLPLSAYEAIKAEEKVQ